MMSRDPFEEESMTASLQLADPRLFERQDLTVDDLVDLIDPPAGRVTCTQYLLGVGENYHQRLQTDELVTVDQPWEITLDLPAWTRKRDWLQEVARP
ncbi:hypothetical protein ACQPZJ_44995 [Actinoplanes sp. CA-054009]